MRSKRIVCLLLVSVTLAVYWQVIDHDFLLYDDPLYVTANPRVKAGLNLDNILWVFTSFSASNWHPLTWLSHMLDVQLFGLSPRGHHMMNVFFHLANTLLLFLLLDKMTASVWKSAFVAALFALHPLHVESVAWISERKDVLSTMFFLMTLLCYYRYGKVPNRFRYMLTMCVFSLGLMSKPMLVTMPFVMLLMDYWPLGRMDGSGIGRIPGARKIPKKENALPVRLVWEKIPFFALSAASCVVTLYAQSRSAATLKGNPVFFRCVNALLAYVYYIGKMFWPYNLAVIYPLPATWTILQGGLAALLLAGITVLSVSAANRHPYLLVGWLWYLGTLVPVIGLVQVGRQFIADRYTYVPLIGLFIMAAWGIPIIVRGERSRRIVLSAAGGLILLACTVTTWFQLGYWKDSVTLFQHAIRAIPDNHLARNILGEILLGKGRVEEAIFQFSQVLKGRPEDEDALFGLGLVLSTQGKDDEALRYFRQVLQIDPESGDAHFEVGLILAARGKLDECIYHFSRVLQTKPEDAEAHHNLGVALAKRGNLDEAIFHFKEALRINPDLEGSAANLKETYKLKMSTIGRKHSWGHSIRVLGNDRA